MAKNDGALKLYTDADMVDATFAGEEVRIPKKWVGTEYADGYVVGGEKAVEIPEGDPKDTWTVPQLTAWAAKQEPPVDLGGATKKDDVVAIVVKSAS